MHSQMALTEHASLNLAPLILLNPVVRRADAQFAVGILIIALVSVRLIRESAVPSRLLVLIICGSKHSRDHPNIQVSHLLADLCWVDLNLGSSLGRSALWGRFVAVCV